VTIVLEPAAQALADATSLRRVGGVGDVLRDEGEAAYAAKLRAARVPVTTVRYDGTVHDFMLLDSLSQSRATRAATAQAIAFLRAAFGTG
jgi:acetyl esterase/lipase